MKSAFYPFVLAASLVLAHQAFASEADLRLMNIYFDDGNCTEASSMLGQLSDAQGKVKIGVGQCTKIRNANFSTSEYNRSVIGGSGCAAIFGCSDAGLERIETWASLSGVELGSTAIELTPVTSATKFASYADAEQFCGTLAAVAKAVRPSPRNSSVVFKLTQGCKVNFDRSVTWAPLLTVDVK